MIALLLLAILIVLLAIYYRLSRTYERVNHFVSNVAPADEYSAIILSARLLEDLAAGVELSDDQERRLRREVRRLSKTDVN